jgi:prepilin-type processing-associated H-X9-DG protein/prepilin-type N-terminal cleavage/methylation domain-containing protein
MKTRAFTLLEILIVIGIIALLAAILFPAFGRVREAGRRTTCASNLKQISLAFTQYAQDYKFYPVLSDDGSYGSFPSPPGTPCGAWPDKMLPYVKEKSIFVCPSDLDHRYDTGCPPDDTSNPDHHVNYRGSYSFNDPYGSLYFNPTTKQPTASYSDTHGASPMRYTRPSSTILISDGVNYYWAGNIAPGYTQPPPTDVASLSNYGVPNRHSGGINVAFADGHVKWMSLDSLLKLSLWRINGPE